TVRDGFADPLKEATLTDNRDTVFGCAAELVGGAAIVQQWPPELADNEHLRAICHRRTRCSTTLPNNVERFGTAHAGQPSREGPKRGLPCPSRRWARHVRKVGGSPCAAPMAAPRARARNRAVSAATAGSWTWRRWCGRGGGRFRCRGWRAGYAV